MENRWMKRRPLKARSIRFESLERRELLASDISYLHNFVMPEDTDASGLVAPIDALAVINHLNNRQFQSTNTVASDKLLDVNADGSVTPQDALNVINCLNKQRNEAGSVSSGVGSDRRIARIEQALSSGQIPFNVSVDRATEILATLRAGGRPELGHRMVGSELYHEDILSSVQEKLDRLSARLGELGVSTATIDEITTKIQTAVEAGETDLRSLIRTELESAGIDFSSLIHDRSYEDLIASFADKLKSVGIDPEVVDNLILDIKEAVAAGDTNIRELIKTKLEEAGIDLKQLLGDIDSTRLLNKLSERLTRLGVEPEVIESLVEDIRNALENGETDLREFIKTKLAEAGIDLPALIEDARNNQLLDKLELRLQAAGIDADTIADVIADIRAGIEAGATDVRALVKSTLEKAGIDLSTLVNDEKYEALLERLKARLEEIGVEQTVIDTLMSSIRESFANGNPMSLRQLAEKLRDAGVDPADIFPGNSGQHGNPTEVNVREILGKLRMLGVSAETIEFISTKIAELKQSGTKITATVFLRVLVESGGIRPELIQRLREFLERR
jgi:predicted metallo-beta-lactamase superfamily hydrolase